MSSIRRSVEGSSDNIRHQTALGHAVVYSLLCLGQSKMTMNYFIQISVVTSFGRLSVSLLLLHSFSRSHKRGGINANKFDANMKKKQKQNETTKTKPLLLWYITAEVWMKWCTGTYRWYSPRCSQVLHGLRQSVITKYEKLFGYLKQYPKCNYLTHNQRCK